MKTSINDGGPEFPHFKITEKGHIELCPQEGMTLRDYFAGQALYGLLSGDEYRLVKQEADKRGLKRSTVLAPFSYDIADAMLAARERKEDAP